MEKELRMSLPQLGVVAATRGMIGFGAGLLLANKLSRENRKAIGLPLLVAGLASTIPIAFSLFCRKNDDAEH
jgi:hypothetical protein